ncbi:LOW QUALITY PROTEIN: RNA-binding protein 34 [Drosophila gunungcola]|uniref:LOW QUALITY PROTEIN: RNA-binding protein 34 n=1 Tax=Drosophila gunungcola TaxID=103775 RepID=UPI0022E1ABD1|nr:LOW QUALITY PROTEIN: RNA-binding protein 34 [Drosophila gunungcola]
MKTPKTKEPKKAELKPIKKEPGVAEEGKVVKKAKNKPKKKAVKVPKEEVKAAVQESPKKLSEKDLAKIEKKKAKKQAQKLKKQQNKQSPKEVKKEPETAVKVEEKPAKKEKAEAKSAAKENPKGKVTKKAKANNKNEEGVKRERNPADEAATVFVGNLPINTKRVQLVKLFHPYGVVQSIRMRTAGGKQLFKHKQRKGAGSLNAYVVLQSPEIAQQALALNGSEFKENHLRVTPAAKVERQGHGQDQQPNDADAKRTIFVGSLKYSANEEKLREIFSSCGEIDYIRCLQDGDKGCKGVAYVCFQKPDAVGLALELNQTVLDDRPINVERYQVKKLGAKQVRDAAAASAASSTSSKTKAKKQNSAGAKKRLDKKKVKENGSAAKETKEAATGGQKKKSQYRGVKVDGIKKAKKPKKKSNDQQTALAKKIAPKPKS